MMGAHAIRVPSLDLSMSFRDVLRRDAGILLLLMAFFSVLYFSLEDRIYDVDQIGYIEGARSILAGRGYLVPADYSLDSLLHAADSGFQEPIEEPGYNREVRPILYGYTLALFMRIFGAGVTTATVLSTLCGLWTLALVFVIARQIAGRTAAVLATILTGTSYFFWRASISIMTESLATALGVTGATLFLAYLTTDRAPLLAGAGVFYGIATAARPQQVVLAIASVLAYAAVKRGFPRKEILAILAGVLLFGSALIPQYLYSISGTMLYARVALFSLDYFWKGEANGVNRPAWQLLPYLRAFLFSGQLIFPPASLLLIAGVCVSLRRAQHDTMFLLLWMAGVFAVLSVERYYSLRYLSQAVVPGYLMVAYGLAMLTRTLSGRIGPGRSRSLAVVASALMVGLALPVSAWAVAATVGAHRARVAPFEYLHDHGASQAIVLGLWQIGRFHHPGPFFAFDGDSEVLQRIASGARKAGRPVFVVLPLQRTAQAENEFAGDMDNDHVRSQLRAIGARKVWERKWNAPLSNWMPGALSSRFSETWAVYAL